MTDFDDQVFLEEAIRQHEQNVRFFELQAIKHGLNVPLSIHNQLVDEKAALARRQAEWRALTQGSATPPPATHGAPQARSAAAPASADKFRLRQVFGEYFNESELRDLTFDMNIDYEDLPGGGTGAKSRELIMFAERHGRYAELVAQVRVRRPHVDL